MKAGPDMAVGPPADDEGPSAEDHEDCDDSTGGPTPNPTRVLRGQPGELLEGEDDEIESLEEQSRLLDYIAESQANEERLKAEFMEENKKIMAYYTEQHALCDAERTKLQKVTDDA